MKINVTGSHGFIGSRLLPKLISDKRITGLSLWDLEIGRPLSEWHIDGCDIVVHLAALADIRGPYTYEDFYVTNVAESRRIFNSGRRVVYASSSAMYNKDCNYGISKALMEKAANPDSIGLRFTTVYGPGQRDTMLHSRLESGNIKYATNHIRDFIHVDDVCDIIIKCIFSDITGAMDVGTGIGQKVSDIVKEAGYDVPIVDGEPGESQDNTADITRLKELGWL